MLHQLKNGNWIDPALVVQIRAEPGWGAGPGLQVESPSVALRLAERCHTEIIRFETLEAAHAYRDELAALVNEAAKAAEPAKSWRDRPSMI